MFVPLFSSPREGRRRVVHRRALGRWYCSTSSPSKGVVGMFVPLFSSSREGGRRIVLHLVLGRWRTVLLVRHFRIVHLSSSSRGGSRGIVLRLALGRWRTVLLVRRFRIVLLSSSSGGSSGRTAPRHVILGRWHSVFVYPLRGARWRRQLQRSYCLLRWRRERRTRHGL